MGTKVLVPTPDGEREFDIGKPGVKVYIEFIKFISRLITMGYERAVMKMAGVIAAGGEVSDVMLAFYAVDQLAVDDIERLSALLLHFEDEKAGVEFVAMAGFDLVWFTDALAANLEQVNVGAIVKNLRRAADAVRLSEKKAITAPRSSRSKS
jgi:hypothetical protein